jgi:hypothetical protein
LPGRGSELATSCDLVYVAEDARIGYPPTRLMSPPDNQFHPWLLGMRTAMEMFLTGDAITGAEAAAKGFANRAFPAAELEKAVLEIAERVALVPTELQQINKRARPSRDGDHGAARRDPVRHRDAGPRLHYRAEPCVSSPVQAATGAASRDLLSQRDAPFSGLSGAREPGRRSTIQVTSDDSEEYVEVAKTSVREKVRATDGLLSPVPVLRARAGLLDRDRVDDPLDGASRGARVRA